MRYRISEYNEYCQFVNHMSQTLRSIDSVVEKSQPSLNGFCSPCKKIIRYQISDTSRFGSAVNLRESISCECGMSQRARLIFDTTLANLVEGKSIALFESSTPLSLKLSQHYSVSESSFIDRNVSSGALCVLNEKEVIHQDMTKMSYVEESFDALIHNDILEHIPDYKKALRECYRVLRVNGLMFFTVPFFGLNKMNIIRAVFSKGEISHLLPKEMHGDPLNPDGILTYYNFGFELINDLKLIFENVYVEINIDILSGYTSNNHPDPFWNMPPIVIVAKK